MDDGQHCAIRDAGTRGLILARGTIAASVDRSTDDFVMGNGTNVTKVQRMGIHGKPGGVDFCFKTFVTSVPPLRCDDDDDDDEVDKGGLVGELLGFQTLLSPHERVWRTCTVRFHVSSPVSTCGFLVWDLS